MVDKKDYARASGMLSLADSISNIIAPAAAGILLGIIGVSGILTIDIVTFIAAVSILLMLVIPQPQRTEEKKSILKDAVYGFGYIAERRGLLGLQLSFFASNLVMGFAFTVLTPMLMLRTGNDTVITGAVQAAFASAELLGG